MQQRRQSTGLSSLEDHLGQLGKMWRVRKDQQRICDCDQLYSMARWVKCQGQEDYSWGTDWWGGTG